MAKKPGIDPITFEVIKNKLQAIATEQSITLKSASGSPVVTESSDFGNAICLADGTIVVRGQQLIPHASSITYMLKSVIEDCRENPGYQEGNMFFVNDPWKGALHQSDVGIVAPFFYEGKLIAWSGTVAHQIDVGGMYPGSWCPNATEKYQEGVSFPPVKLVEKGKIRKDIEDLVIRNSRTPKINALNFRARLAAINRARERIEHVIQEYGKDTFLEVQQGIMDLVQKAFERRLHDLPDGTWCEEGFIDHDGNNNILYRLKLAMTKKGDKLTFDFTGTDPQAPGLINCTRTGLEGGVMSAVLPLLCYDTIWSPSALEKNVEITAALGTLNNASHPAAVSLATLSSAYATGILAVATIGKMLACSSTYKKEAQATWAPSVQVCNIAGFNTRGEYYNGALTDQAGGGGACIDKDGMHTAGITGSPCNSITNIETAESLYPILCIYRKHAKDVIGPGKFRGGAGTEIMRITYGNAGPIDSTFYSYGACHPAGKGIYGGLPPSIQTQLLLKNTNLEELMKSSYVPTSWEELSSHSMQILNSKERFNFDSGDVYVSISMGGSGFGDPLMREPRLVLKDLQHNLHSPGVCRDIYGVICDKGNTEILYEETEKQRELLREKRIKGGKHVGNPPQEIAFSGEQKSQEILSLGEAIKLIEINGKRYYACYYCGYNYGEGDKSPQNYALVREIDIKELSPVNKFSLSDEIIARQLFCPNCALLIGVEIRKKGDPVIFDTLISNS